MESVESRPPTTRLLQRLHPHPLDERIRLEEGPHRYVVDGAPCGGSVTGLCHSHSAGFDEVETVARMKAGPNWPRPAYAHHRRLPLAEAAALLFHAGLEHLPPEGEPPPSWAGSVDAVTQLVLGLSAPDPDPVTGEVDAEVVAGVCEAMQRLRGEARQGSLPAALARAVDAATDRVALSGFEIAEAWRRLREDATQRGTWFHLQAELWLNQDPSCQKEGPEMRLFFRYLTEHLEPLGVDAFRTEWGIFASDLAGSVDFVGRYTEGPLEGQLLVVDWKRTKGLRHKADAYGRGMEPPLGFVPDSSLWHYVLQLNVYAWILEHRYGHRVARLEIVCVHEDNGDAPLIVHAPRMALVTEYLLAWHGARCRGDEGGLEEARRRLLEEGEPKLPELEFVELAARG